jgi:hypothetical protein
MEMRTIRVALLLVASLAACKADNDASIEVYALCSPPDDAEQCGTSGECDEFLTGRPFAATRISPGSPPVGIFQNEFAQFVQVNNQMPNNADEDTFRVNTKDFTIEEYRLSYRSTPGIDIPDFVYKANEVVPAAGTAAPLVTLIPWEVMEVIDDADPVYPSPTAPVSFDGAIVEVELRLFGHTRDGSEIESAPWVLPVEVRDEVAFDPVCLDTGVFIAACPGIGQTASVACE